MKSYLPMPPRRIRTLRTGGNFIKSLMAVKPLRDFIKKQVTGGKRGPSAKARKKTTTEVWARAAGPNGEAEAWLVCPEGYEYTAAGGHLSAVLNSENERVEFEYEGSTGKMSGVHAIGCTVYSSVRMVSGGSLPSGGCHTPPKCSSVGETML